MAITQKEELLKYIKFAIELETDVVVQTNLYSSYCTENTKRLPQLVKLPLPQEPAMPVACSTQEDFNFKFIAGLVAGISIFMGITSLALPTFAYLGWPLLIIGGIAVALIFLRMLAPQKRANEQYQSYYLPAKERYEKESERIRQLNKEKHALFVEQTSQWQAATNKSTALMTERMDKTQATLERLYAMDVIYPKYRNLPALTSIYEYLITGRCEELSGPHGAYNLYEDEVRKDTVISQLNTVIENLEQIKQSQYMLYQQVKAIQENTSTIASELRQIRGYTVQIAQLTALNTYYAALNERNTRITMYYHL